MIPRLVRPAALVALGLFVVVGCGPSAATAAPVDASTGNATAAAESAAPTPRPADGQTDTDWGRIWDRLPTGFPVFAGATRSEETHLGPASAVSVVERAKAADVIDWYEVRLQAAGYTTVARNGPMEDGSFTLDSTGRSADCRLEITAAPLGTGDIVAITVWYGAACPNEG